MPDYFRIEQGFWSTKDTRAIRQLGGDHLLVAVYLRTAPMASPFGLFYIPLPMVCHETGLTIEGASKVLLDLEKAGFARYDHEAEVAWVPSMARANIDPITSPGDKRAKWASREVATLREFPFFDLFLREHGAALHLGDVVAPRATPKTEGPSKDLPRTSEANTPTPQPQQIDTRPARPCAGPPPAAVADLDRRNLFLAVTRGLGMESLTWNAGNSFLLERIEVCRPKNLEEVERVARHYAAGMTPPAKPSFRRFCEAYDERRAQYEASRKPSGPVKRPPNRARETSTPGMLYCEVHGMGYQAAQGCRPCRDEGHGGGR